MKFSVLASVYIKEKPSNLSVALDSVFNQTLLPDEFVLIKDGPLTPELDAIIDKYLEMHPDILKVIPLTKNMGLGNALNIGLENVSNEVVVRMDTDDICYEDRFEKLISFMSLNPDVSVIGSAVQEFDKEPMDLNQFRVLPESNKELIKFSKYRNPMNHPSVAFKKSAVIDSGSYQDMMLFEDYYLWMRIIDRGYKLANLPDVLLHFRIGNDMIGRRSGIGYVKKELHFLKTIRDEGMINNKEYLYSVISKAPLRLLPKRVLTFLYKKMLR